MRTIRILVLLIALTSVLTSCQRNNTAVREFQVQASDVSLHVRMAGNPDSGRVLIAINGGPGLTSNYMWDMERLAGPDCAVLTYDQRGLGKSTQPADPDSTASYSLQKYAEDVEAIRQAVGAERLHVMGHSWGGIVAMEYAILYPEHVASLIFFGGGPPTWKDIEIAKLSFYQRVERLIQSGVIPPQSEWADDGSDPMLPANFSDPAFTFPEDSLGGPPEFSQVVSDLTYPNLVGMDLRAELALVQKPVLLMFGRDDPLGLPMAEATRDALANAQVDFVVIERCGHFWHECPDGFYPRVKEFLGQTRATSPTGAATPPERDGVPEATTAIGTRLTASERASVPRGCTVFTVAKGDQVFFGGNDDYINPDSYYWVDRGGATGYGAIWIGRPDNVQQGVNEKGLAYDANGLPEVTLKAHPERLAYPGGMNGIPIHILRRCATVEEVIEWAQTHAWYPVMNDQKQFADASGDAVIISPGPDGELVFTRKPSGDSFLVSTNFNVANPSHGYGQDSRYGTAQRMLGQLVSRQSGLTAQDVAGVLDAVHAASGTSWTIESLVADLPNRVVYLYYFHQFDKPVVLKVQEEIAHVRAGGRFSQLFPEDVQQEAARRYERIQAQKNRGQVLGKVWLGLVLASLVVLLLGSINKRQGLVFWLPVVAILGPLGLVVWLVAGRSQQPRGWQKALVEATGDVAPTAVALVIMPVLMILVPGGQSSAALQVGCIFILPFLVGWLAFQGPLLALMIKKGYLRTLGRRLAHALVAANLGMGGIFAIGMPLFNKSTSICPILPLSLSTVMVWWAIAVLGALAGGLVLFLFESWVVHRGFQVWSVLASGEGEARFVSWRKLWWWILLSYLALFAGVAAGT